MNDSKYGRLHPERAVLPIRRLCESLLVSATSSGGDGQTVVHAKALRGVLEVLDRNGFPKNEPLFLLRGQDTLAPPIVRQYAEDAAAEGAHGIGTGEPEGQEAFDHMMEQADAMERWTPQKLPD